MKICILVYNVNLHGGLEIVSKRLEKQFKSVGICAEIISLCEQFVLNKRLSKNKIKNISQKIIENDFTNVIISLPDPFCALADLRLARELEKKTRVDYVIHNSPLFFIKRYRNNFDNSFVYFLKYIKTKVYIKPRAIRFFKLCYRCKIGIITISSGNKNELEKYYGIKAPVIKNAFDITAIRKNSFKDKLHQIIFCGRMDFQQKNLFFLLDAWKLVKHRDWKLIMVGRGEKKLLYDYIEFNRISEVELVEEVAPESINRLFENSSITVLTSLYEGFPTVFLEAAANCNALVSTKYDGYSDEILKNGVNGFVTDFDLMQFADKLQILMDNRELLLLFQENSLKLFLNYSKTTAVDEWLSYWAFRTKEN